jgi:hypothetical protein
MKKILAHPNLVEKLKRGLKATDGGIYDGIQLISSPLVDETTFYFVEPPNIFKELGEFTSMIGEALAVPYSFLCVKSSKIPSCINWLRRVIRNKKDLKQGDIFRRWFFYKKWHNGGVLRYLKPIDNERFLQQHLSSGETREAFYSDCGMDIDKTDRRFTHVRFELINREGCFDKYWMETLLFIYAVTFVLGLIILWP